MGAMPICWRRQQWLEGDADIEFRKDPETRAASGWSLAGDKLEYRPFHNT
jgi:hypothetical protein